LHVPPVILILCAASAARAAPAASTGLADRRSGDVARGGHLAHRAFPCPISLSTWNCSSSAEFLGRGCSNMARAPAPKAAARFSQKRSSTSSAMSFVDCQVGLGCHGTDLSESG